jgi:DNA ligase-1
VPGAGAVHPVAGPEAPFADLVGALEAVRATSSTHAKVATLAGYLAALGDDDLRRACRFLLGSPFPPGDPRRLMVGGAALSSVLLELTGASVEELRAAYVARGDLGEAAEALLARRPPAPGLFSRSLTLRAVAEAFEAIAACQGPSSRRAKLAAVRALLQDASPAEAKYLVKIMTSDLRVGVQEGLLLAAIAHAVGVPAEEVRRAALVVADPGEIAVWARRGALGSLRLLCGRPFRFMLASQVSAPEEALEDAPEVLVEDKYDGIRVQVHHEGGRLALFSRTLEDITGAFPELLPALAALAPSYVLDGEVIAWREGRPLGFTQLQQRLRRRDPGPLLREIPVVLVAFDLLYLEGGVLIDRPLRERRALLEGLPWRHPLFVSEATWARTGEELEARFRLARARGHEGIVMKRPDAPYEPGRRGRLWLKWKPGVGTLDVVVVAAEYGHGKRAGVLSDYTFAVRSGEGLATIGKAYSGLTDAEIDRLSRWFLEHTVEDRGFVRLVEPRIVLEVAFDAITQSSRHDSGFALRFPRIVRIRDDKPPDEINTLEDVRELYIRLHRRRGPGPDAPRGPGGGGPQEGHSAV